MEDSQTEDLLKEEVLGMDFLHLLDLEIQADLVVQMALVDFLIMEVYPSDLLELEDQMHHHAQQF